LAAEISLFLGMPMRIAVIADTHDRYPPKLIDLLKPADEIWHLGDVCDPTVLIEFEQLRRPIRVVLGNNDDHAAWPLTLNLQRNGLRFHLEHIPPRHPPLHCDVVIHGHTHVPRDESLGGVRWLNPGCISRPNRGWGPSFGWLNFHPKAHAYDWELVTL
jgi:putative phosphoesterase